MTQVSPQEPTRFVKPGRFWRVAPYWLPLAVAPLPWVGAMQGGLWVLLPVFSTWILFSLLDHLVGLDLENIDPQTDADRLWAYRLVTMLWVPAQAASLFGLAWYVPQATHLSGWEIAGIAFGTGVMTGTIGINFSHELMHQRNRTERWLSDLLLAMVLYSHFRSEHLLVHHRYVATPRDPVTARMNENFHRYFPRVVLQCGRSAFAAEAAQLARKGLPWWNRGNPFWVYWSLQAVALVLATALGGWLGLVFFVAQAYVAIWQLELVNYIEHYGLTRRHLGDGRYEHVRPHHSWNASQRASNWLLINLQRHSDHHYKPDRRFPLLQTHPETDAPQLPYGYPVMTLIALVPPLWRRVMNKRVAAWRARFYPEISDWSAYDAHTTPMPR